MKLATVLSSISFVCLAAAQNTTGGAGAGNATGNETTSVSTGLANVNNAGLATVGVAAILALLI